MSTMPHWIPMDHLTPRFYSEELWMIHNLAVFNQWYLQSSPAFKMLTVCPGDWLASSISGILISMSQYTEIITDTSSLFSWVSIMNGETCSSGHPLLYGCSLESHNLYLYSCTTRVFTFHFTCTTAS